MVLPGPDLLHPSALDLCFVLCMCGRGGEGWGGFFSFCTWSYEGLTHHEAVAGSADSALSVTTGLCATCFILTPPTECWCWSWCNGCDSLNDAGRFEAARVAVSYTWCFLDTHSQHTSYTRWWMFQVFKQHKTYPSCMSSLVKLASSSPSSWRYIQSCVSNITH